jgi:glycerophosphoryl diester phosphodiesterase
MVFSFLVAVVVPFFVCWTIVNKFPRLLHPRRQLGSKGLCNIIAHRGSREEGLPENTLAAFQDAIMAGADVIELDVWLTLDNEVVVHHDEKLSRMTNGACTSAIHELEYSQLPAIGPPHPIQGERCRDRVEQGESNLYGPSHWSRIPRLHDVLGLIPCSKTAVIVEIKQDSDLLISKVHSLLTQSTQFDYRQNCYWFSLTESINKKLRAKDPSIATITSISGMLRVLGLYYMGLLPFSSIDDCVFGVTVEEITLETVMKEKAIKGFPLWVKHSLAYMFRGRPPRPMVAPKLFTYLRERGIPVWFLGVNNEEDLKLAVESGATAVLTDRVNWAVNSMKTNRLSFRQIKGL